MICVNAFLTITWVPTNLTITVIWNTTLRMYYFEMIATRLNVFLNDYSKTESYIDLKMASVPTDLMIPVILNPILEHLRPSEAEIEDCGMRRRAAFMLKSGFGAQQ